VSLWFRSFWSLYFLILIVIIIIIMDTVTTSSSATITKYISLNSFISYNNNWSVLALINLLLISHLSSFKFIMNFFFNSLVNCMIQSLIKSVFNLVLNLLINGAILVIKESLMSIGYILIIELLIISIVSI
jgi:hypothetical protein